MSNPKVGIPKTVWVLGFVSLLMDISSEMIHALLPLFMAGTLGASAVWIGLVEGVGEGAALITKVFSGVIADRFGHKKWLVFIGYFLGVISKPVFALADVITVVLGARLFDRIGKGMRGAPRDAIVAEVTDESNRGAAYGLRQSLDAAGAFLGPLLATLLLLLWTQDLQAIFWVALIPGVACLMLILLGVEDKVAVGQVQKRISWSEIPSVMTPAFRQLVLIGTLFSLARFSNAFIILRADNVGIQQAWIPMVMVLKNISFSFSSYPFGKLADSMNPRRLLEIGLVLLAGANLVFAVCSGPYSFLAGVCLFGLHLGAHPKHFLDTDFRSGRAATEGNCLRRIQFLLRPSDAVVRSCCRRSLGVFRSSFLFCRRYCFRGGNVCMPKNQANGQKLTQSDATTPQN